MQGLGLSRLYYGEYCAPMLEKQFPGLAGQVAAGLVGEGSECLGLDDAISRDHDWGAAVCLWLNARDHRLHGKALQKALDGLPGCIRGFPVRRESRWATGRSGVLEIEAFYHRHLGFGRGPESLLEWLRTDEFRLSAATNGAVFADPAGEFTAIRNKLLAFYPEDVRLKKLAARCATIAQSGQYNFPRCVRRKEYVAAAMAEAEFMDSACSAVFLLNRRYKPFYKWMHKAMRSLPVLGQDVFDKLSQLPDLTDKKTSIYEKKIDLIEEIASMLLTELRVQKLSDATGDFLLDHSLSVQSKIHDATIRKISIFAG
jgi:hypothetical protein